MSWTPNEPSSAVVCLGNSADKFAQVGEAADLTTSHQLLLTGLAPDTTCFGFHGRVRWRVDTSSRFTQSRLTVVATTKSGASSVSAVGFSNNAGRIEFEREVGR